MRPINKKVGTLDKKKKGKSVRETLKLGKSILVIIEESSKTPIIKRYMESGDVLPTVGNIVLFNGNGYTVVGNAHDYTHANIIYYATVVQVIKDGVKIDETIKPAQEPVGECPDIPVK